MDLDHLNIYSTLYQEKKSHVDVKNCHKRIDVFKMQ